MKSDLLASALLRLAVLQSHARSEAREAWAWVRFWWFLGLLVLMVGCGGAPFEAAPDDIGGSASTAAADAGIQSISMIDGSDAAADVAGDELERDGSTRVDTGPPSVDAGDELVVAGHDAAPPPPDTGPPPPALCCVLSCSGAPGSSSIPCNATYNWTCAAGACGACALSAACSWQSGACTGVVKPC